MMSRDPDNELVGRYSQQTGENENNVPGDKEDEQADGDKAAKSCPRPSEAKEKEDTADVKKTPDTNPEDFEPVRGRNAKKKGHWRKMGKGRSS